MIIEFRVKNFRSFKDEQVFSLDTSSAENSTPIPQTKKRVLNSAGVYGANASGKSNLLKAIYELRRLVIRSWNWDEAEGVHCFDPYRLSQVTQTQPVEFEIDFITTTENRFRYSVAFTQERIKKEQLKHYSSQSKRWVTLFSRKGSGTQDIKFCVEGGKEAKQIKVLKHQAYLSVAGRDAKASEVVRDAYLFIRRDIFHFQKDTDAENDLTAKYVVRSIFPKISSILQLADTGVEKVSIEETSNELDMQKRFIAPYRLVCHHCGEDGTFVPFDLKDESEGTQRLYNRLPYIIDALEKGKVLVIDELENSLHPFLCELIIRLFHDPEVNKYGAQLIFSTHDISLLSSKLLNPERKLLGHGQIWFTEKKDGMTTLFSLADFDKKEVNDDSPVAQWYEQGRFGAFPRYHWHKIKQLFTGEEQNG